MKSNFKLQSRLQSLRIHQPGKNTFYNSKTTILAELLILYVYYICILYYVILYYVMLYHRTMSAYLNLLDAKNKAY